jgi:hypothetical protein
MSVFYTTIVYFIYIENVFFRLKKSKIPRFRISGRLDSTLCKITEPFTGELCVEHCDAVIRSIELQLVRVETCGCAEGYARDGMDSIDNIFMRNI